MQKPRARTAPALLDELSQRQPHREAIVDGDRRWSYGEFQHQAHATAAGLWELGVRPGDRVAILMGNRAEWLASYFAIMGLGATAVALNTWLTPSEQAYQLTHSAVTTLIMADRFRERDILVELEEMQSLGLPALRRVIVLGDRIPPEATDFRDLAVLAKNLAREERAKFWSAAKPEDTACILYTSGSTARPKGVPLQHWGLIDNMWEIGERMHLTQDDRLWFAVSLFWAFGCVNALFAILSHGGVLVLQHHFDAGVALRLIEQERCSIYYGTPNMALALMEHPDRPKRDLASLRTGAAIGTPEQIQLVVDLGAQDICNVYGLTEAYGNSSVSDAEAPLAQRLQASGQPLPGVDVQILDLDTRKPLAQGQVGEIALKGRISPGYLDDPEATAASLNADDFFLTGDLGLKDGFGWLHFQGRLKELIKSGGINISPAEIETVLRCHEAVESAFVTGLDDDRLDQVIGAVVVLQDAIATPGTESGKSDMIAALQQYCRKSLAAYKVPSRFVFVAANQLPMTSTEKLQRNRLALLFDKDEQQADSKIGI